MKLNPSSGAVKFSSALLTTDLNDFLAPSDACILPLNGGASASKPSVAPPGSVAAPIFEEATKAVPTAKVTLSDCLACSGCLTSAETVLLETQSPSQLDYAISRKESDGMFVICSLSQQSVASICASVGADASSPTALLHIAQKLVTKLRARGIDAVLDVAVGRGISLIALADEFDQRLEKQSRLPMLSSACPGFVCYVEKTHPALIPLIAETKSPQAMLGTVAKSVLPEQPVWMAQTSGKTIFHCSVMPCFDKKLEASREELKNAGSHEIDAVLTSAELWEWLGCRDAADLLNEAPSNFDSPLLGPQMQSEWFGTGLSKSRNFGKVASSGGYADYLVSRKRASNTPEAETYYKALRNSDLMEAVYMNDAGEESSHRIAIANGFRNIQNITRRVKRGVCPYDFVEIMSCPGGCTNGAGQIHDDNSSLARVKERLKAIDVFNGLAECGPVPNESPGLQKLVLVSNGPGLSTSYQEVQKTASSLAW